MDGPALPQRPTLRIREVDVATVRPVRLAVLRAGLPASSGHWEGDDEPLTFHLGAYAGRELAGAASFMAVDLDGHAAALGGQLALPPGSAYKLRGMAVLPEFQRGGIGSRLLDAGLLRVRERGALLLWCHARCTAQGFYARHGFDAFGAVFETSIAVPHIVMWRMV